MIVGKIADGNGGIASPVAQAEEDIDAYLAWAGCGRLRTEVGDGLTADGILLIVVGDKILCGMAETSTGRRNYTTNNTKSTQGQNWNFQRWLVKLVYLHERRQK